MGPNNAEHKKDVLSSAQKRAKLKTKNITTAFVKSLFLLQYRIRYAIYIPPNTKDLEISLTMVVYGNRQNAIVFPRANNSELLQVLKHLMETRLNSIKYLIK